MRKTIGQILLETVAIHEAKKAKARESATQHSQESLSRSDDLKQRDRASTDSEGDDRDE